jgi:hypothetical protein
VSRADAATILERARALLSAERDRAISDRSDESVPEDAPSVALIAYGAAPVDGVDPSQALLKAFFDDYVAGTSGLVLITGFASWATAAGFTHEYRGGVDVALDGSGRVVAAMDGSLRRDPPATRRERQRSRWVRRAHTHGFARIDGAWICVQDYYVPGNAPGTSCGRTWDQAARQ